jgi:uncharacterized protein
VIDTNVLVSAAIKPAGLQRTVFLIAISKPAHLYVSHPILEEYSEVLARPELRIRKGLRLQLLQLIKNHSHTVVPTRRLEATTDPADNIFLECADAARADYLVTGNQKNFFKILEENKGCNPTGVCQSCGTTFNKVADCSTACIKLG